MFQCERCGCEMTEVVVLARRKRGKDLWGCAQCRGGKQARVKTAFGLCQPHQGLFDDDDNPLDKFGRLYRPGVRLCGYRDCVAVDHLVLAAGCRVDSGIGRALRKAAI
jgi:hypothetical protein